MKNSIKRLIAKVRHPSCYFGSGSIVSFDSHLQGNNYLGAGCKILSSNLGQYSYVGDNAQVMLTNISRYVSIAPSVVIGLQGHDLQLASTYPPFWFSNQSCNRCAKIQGNMVYKLHQTIVEADCWIGHSALIKAGVKLSVGSVVGAGAVVTKDLEPYGIYVGSPARLLRYRFSSSVITRLLSSKWWDMDFKDAQAFLQKFHEHDLQD